MSRQLAPFLAQGGAPELFRASTRGVRRARRRIPVDGAFCSKVSIELDVDAEDEDRERESTAGSKERIDSDGAAKRGPTWEPCEGCPVTECEMAEAATAVKGGCPDPDLFAAKRPRGERAPKNKTAEAAGRAVDIIPRPLRRCPSTPPAVPDATPVVGEHPSPLYSRSLLLPSSAMFAQYSPLFTSGLLSESNSPASSSRPSAESETDSRQKHPRGSLPVDVNLDSIYEASTSEDDGILFTLAPRRRRSLLGNSFLSLDLAESRTTRSMSLRRKDTVTSRSTTHFGRSVPTSPTVEPASCVVPLFAAASLLTSAVVRRCHSPFSPSSLPPGFPAKALCVTLLVKAFQEPSPSRHHSSLTYPRGVLAQLTSPWSPFLLPRSASTVRRIPNRQSCLLSPHSSLPSSTPTSRIHHLFLPLRRRRRSRISTWAALTELHTRMYLFVPVLPSVRPPRSGHVKSTDRQPLPLWRAE